jgi:phosphatidylglycerophosphate synthase
MSLLLALMGFACLAMAMNRHHGEALGAKPSARRARVLRFVGTTALVLLLAYEMTKDGAAFGALLAFGYASAGAAIVLLALMSIRREHRPRARAKNAP